jgi:hypothetical protein
MRLSTLHAPLAISCLFYDLFTKLSEYTSSYKRYDDREVGTGLEGSDLGFIKILSRHFSGGTGKNHETPSVRVVDV